MFGGEDPSKHPEMIKALKEMKALGNKVSKQRTGPVVPQQAPTPIINVFKSPNTLAGLGQFSGLLQNKKMLTIGVILLLLLGVALLLYKQDQQKKKIAMMAKKLKRLKHAR